MYILLGYEAMSLDTWFMMFSDDTCNLCYLQELICSTGRCLVVVEVMMYFKECTEIFSDFMHLNIAVLDVPDEVIGN
jgi:hypothetical protein